MLTFRCSTHPDYGGWPVPYSDCIACWEIYTIRLDILERKNEYPDGEIEGLQVIEGGKT